MIRPDTLVISRQPGETWVASLEGDDLVDLIIARDGRFAAGAIVRGQVASTLPSHDAVFVDLDHGVVGLLPVKGKVPPDGSMVVAEVSRPALHHKGPKLKLSDRSKQAEQKFDPKVDRGPLLDAGPHPAMALAQHLQASLRHIYCEPADEAASFLWALQRAAPDLTAIVEGASPGTSLFRDFELETDLDEATQREVPLRSGGTMTIDETEALVAIDVDAGGSKAAVANAEALRVLPLELRRRNLGGPMWIDLIPTKANKQKWLADLIEDVSTDPVPVRVAGLTPLGRIELVRDRTQAPLSDLALSPAERHPRTESVALAALRQCVSEGMIRPGKAPELRAHPDVIAVLKGAHAAALASAEDRLKLAVKLIEDESYERSRTTVHVP